MNVWYKLDNFSCGWGNEAGCFPEPGTRYTIYSILCGPALRRRSIGAVLDQQILDDIVREWYERT